MCWSDDCADGSDWCIQLCRPDQRSCLAQYRRNTAGRDVASYFGCHGVGCDPDCIPTVGTASDYSCCCSGDLCNSIPGLTPNGDNLTSPPNPQPTPEVDSTDGRVQYMYIACGLGLYNTIINMSRHVQNMTVCMYTYMYMDMYTYMYIYMYTYMYMCVSALYISKVMSCIHICKISPS